MDLFDHLKEGNSEANFTKAVGCFLANEVTEEKDLSSECLSPRTQKLFSGDTYTIFIS